MKQQTKKSFAHLLLLGCAIGFLNVSNSFAVDLAGLTAAGFKDGAVYKLNGTQNSAYCAAKFKLEILDVNQPYGPSLWISFTDKAPEWKGNFVWSHFPAIDDPNLFVSGHAGVSGTEEELATYDVPTKTINKHFIRKNKDGVVKNNVTVAFRADPSNAGGLLLTWNDSVGSMGSMQCNYSEAQACFNTTKEWSLDIDNMIYKLFFIDRYPVPANGNGAMGPNYNYNAKVFTEAQNEIAVPITNNQHWSMFTTMMKSVYKTHTSDDANMKKPATGFLVSNNSNIILTARHAFEDFFDMETFQTGGAQTRSNLGYVQPIESDRAVRSCNFFTIIARDSAGNPAVSHCTQELIYCPPGYDACFIKMSNFESGSGSLSGQPLSAAGGALALKRSGFDSDHDSSIFLNMIGNVSDKGLQGSRGKSFSTPTMPGNSAGNSKLRYVHFATGPGASGGPVFGDDQKIIGLIKEGAFSNIHAVDNGTLRVPVALDIKGVLDKTQTDMPTLYNDLNIVN